MRFFVGLHQPSDTKHFDAAFISVHRLTGRNERKSPMQIRDWIMDSGAFSTIQMHGGYPEPVSVYAGHIRKWKDCGNLLAAVAQDYMCERVMLERTGLTIATHQCLTIGRYDLLIAEDTGVYIMPVLQGYAPQDYVTHIRMYGDRLAPGAWVGVGSVCKRNANPDAVVQVLRAIKKERPDLRLHGFGLKTTALENADVVDMLYTADSMAWSFAARKQGRDSNNWKEAAAFAQRIAGNMLAASNQPRQLAMEFE